MKLFCDKICVLGLEKKEQQIRNKFDSLFPTSQLDYFITKGVGTGQNDGTTSSSYWDILNHSTIDKISIDIFKNHISIIKKYYQDESIENILILEDDAEFPNWDQHKWNRVEYWLKENPNEWDIFYLGYCNWPYLWSTFKTSSIVKLSSPLTAHAYILNRSGMYKILKTIEKNPDTNKLHIDKLYTKIKRFKKLGIFPMVSFQEKCPGLYLKACDKMGVRVLFSTCSKWNQWISIILPFIILFLIYYFIFYKCLYKNYILIKND